jgi:'Cold-shock' DNA-binding domain
MATGTVIDWKDGRGFGFIQRDDGQGEIFVHLRLVEAEWAGRPFQLSDLIIPAAAAAGAVSLLWDGTNTRTLFAGGGTTALPTLAPFWVQHGAQSGNAGGFKATTGANVAAIAFGKFT